MNHDPPDVPTDEAHRLAVLNDFDILDTPREVIFDELARMAASICEAPIALVSLIDGRRQWFKARHGLEATETPREMAFCAHAIQGSDPLIVNDASEDARFAANPLVTGDPNIRFYAGAPLITSGGEALGTLCVIDRQPRELAPAKIEALRILSRHVVGQLELRRRLKDLSRTHAKRAREMRAVVDEQQNRIEQLAHFDPQTGLGNRSFFLGQVGAALEHAGGGRVHAALFVVELQRFDHLVEGLGSVGIDALLAEIANRLVACAQRPSDVAHLREERFGVLATEVHGATAAALFAESRLLATLDEPFHIDGQELRPVFRIGISIIPADGTDAVTTLAAAKTALVTAKAAPERIAFASPEIAARVAGALTMETKLRRALERDELRLHYQPKIDLATGLLTGVEALLRWADVEARVRNGEPPLVPPGRFIPLLEETGLIVPVGEWVLARAAADQRAWTQAGLAAPRIAVNVSTLQLNQKDFVPKLLRMLAQHGAPRLDIEITEATFLERSDECIARLEALRERGVRVAIDDFGTGYSSLRYLADLPIDVLKIDRSFVEAMVNRPRDLAVVTSIVALASGLNLRTVAEGVETEEQRRMLNALGCHEMQGYLHSRPMPADALVELLTPV